METFYESDHGLGRIVALAQYHRVAWPVILRQAVGILTTLGLSQDEAFGFLTYIPTLTMQSDHLHELEAELHDRLSRTGVYGRLPAKMLVRADKWHHRVAPFVTEHVLDLGGGSGEVAKLLKPAHQVTIADVIDWRRYPEIPFVPVQDGRLVDQTDTGAIVPIADESFDTVLLITVFHHTNDVEGMVREAFRVARKRVVFMESVTNNLTEYMYGAWIDWFYNRVIHYTPDPNRKINVPCRFLPTEGWTELVWRLTGHTPASVHDLGIFQDLNPEHHVLFVYDLPSELP